jgi:hypothetical protein
VLDFRCLARVIERAGNRRVRVAVDFREPLRALVVRERVDDLVGRDRLVLVSPFSRRILFTVRAATSSARAP